MAEVARTGAPDPQPAAVPPAVPHQLHLVVVTTRPAPEPAGAAPMLIIRYWHPRRRAWIEQPVESVEHALRLFVDELGWTLRQQQVLETPEHHELIFEARLERLEQASATEVLEEAGLTPRDVEEILLHVDEQVESDGETR